MGNYNWGSSTGGTGTSTRVTRSSGGSMGQRGVSVGVRESYLDFFMPGTEFRLRMGIQTIWNPNFTFTPMVLAQQLPGVVASFKASDEISVTAFWARPYNENAGSRAGEADGGAAGAKYIARNHNDNFDIFGVTVPLAFDGIKVTPWIMYAQIAPYALDSMSGTTYGGGSARDAVMYGMRPYYWDTNNQRALDRIGRNSLADSTAYWFGLTGDVTMMDPLRIAWDFNYGQVQNPSLGFLNRSGWVLNLLVEYKQDWGIPGLGLWYGSGDDGNTTNGSERMPILDVNSRNSTLSTFGSDGSPVWAGGTWEGIMGPDIMSGTKGLTLRLRDMSFADKLKHTLRFNVYNGNNDPKMGKIMTGKRDGKGIYDWSRAGVAPGGIADYNSPNGVYLTSKDYAFEVSLDTEYKIYDNLSLFVELAYINLQTDKKVWGSDDDRGVRGVSKTDAMKAGLLFRYTF